MNNKVRYLFIVFVIVLFGECTTGRSGKKINLIEEDYLVEGRDSLFRQPFVDIDEWRDEPVRHRYVHGGFEGTDTRFSFYFPPKDQYEGRFFQYITPFPDNENLSQGATGENDKIGFAISSGAYFIETNGGGKTDFTQQSNQDPTIGAYRANAASAEFSRVIAKTIFGGERPYGYAFGGSGGAYRTVGGFQSTDGVWDGVVPYVLGSPAAIPNVFTVRMQAMRLLKNKLPQIVDALEPGGSGDMYAGLNDVEKSALEEVTKMGFPPHAWYGYKDMGIHGFLVLYQGVCFVDKYYFEKDFWNKPGYLGHDHPELFAKDRIQKVTKIKSIIGYNEAVETGLTEEASEKDRGSADTAWKNTGDNGEKPEGYVLEDVLPKVYFVGGDLIIKTGKAEGTILQITKIMGNKVALAPTNPLDKLAVIKPGDEVQMDNSRFLAVESYHRHQDPGPQYDVWNQFRDKEGNPVYPQRRKLLGPMFTQAASGSLPTGKFKGKMILLGSLMDREAFPWQCDWYRQRVVENLGDQADDNFRLWYTEHALHGDAASQLDDPTHAVSYIGVLQQALRDLSAWVEKGIEPAATTNYEIVDGQVIVPATANERKGIQPTVVLTIDGRKRADISAGETVSFNAVVQIPEGQGKLVSAACDFDGSGDFKHVIDLSKVKQSEDGSCVEITIQHTFNEAGTYFPTLRVAANRHGDNDSSFARIQNLDRVRVVIID